MKPDTEWCEVPAGAHGNQFSYLARWLGGLYRVVDPPADNARFDLERCWSWSVWDGPVSRQPLADGQLGLGGEAEAKLAAERWTP